MILLMQGVYVDWKDLVLNTDCITNARVIVTRLVKGRLSDTTKKVVVPVTAGHENITLALPCEDVLPYSIQVNEMP